MTTSADKEDLVHADQAAATEMGTGQKKRAVRSKTFFVDTLAAESFDSAFVSKLGVIRSRATSDLIPQKNIQRYTHGASVHHPAATKLYDGGTHTHSTEITAKYQDLREHNVSALTKTFASVAQSMSEQITASFYRTVSASCDENGQVVDAKAHGSLIDAFEVMMEKLEISVDSQGNPQMPELRLGTEAFDKLINAMENITPEQDARIKSIQTRKIEDGRVREAARQARFANYGAAK
ncbi:hypothetical protein LPN04_31980 [Rugamonas sp. A1-17]|nr:hypothetical protein [Rugamonas sp. A1-17]